MTWIGIVFAFITFVSVAAYLVKRYHQNFYRLFYRLPILILFTYLIGSYTTFILTTGIFPTSWEEFMSILSPYWYNFHFVGMLIWVLISFQVFFKKTKRIENKKIWIDIFFFSFAIAIVPLWIFLLLWDNFIGNTTQWLFSIKALHTDSELNKFNWVYPIGLFLSIGVFLLTIVMQFIRKKRKVFGLGMLWFAALLIVINIVLLLQQYPRYGITSIGSLSFDIKQYASFFVIMLCLYNYFKWSRPTNDPTP